MFPGTVPPEEVKRATAELGEANVTMTPTRDAFVKAGVHKVCIEYEEFIFLGTVGSFSLSMPLKWLRVCFLMCVIITFIYCFSFYTTFRCRASCPKFSKSCLLRARKRSRTWREPLMKPRRTSRMVDSWPSRSQQTLYTVLLVPLLVSCRACPFRPA